MKVFHTQNYEIWRIREPYEFREGSFRIHDIGRRGYSLRRAGILRKSGKWATASIMIHNAEPPQMKHRLREIAKQLIRRR